MGFGIRTYNAGIGLRISGRQRAFGVSQEPFVFYRAQFLIMSNISEIF